MIQRVQSIFLLLSSASFWSLFGIPFASSDQATSGFLADLQYNIQDHLVLLILTVLGGLAALIAIFLYKNRPLQIRLGYVAMVVAILLPVTVILLFYNEASKNFLNVRIDDQLGIYLPLAGILFLALALRYIRKDEKIVRSADRLR